MGSTTSLQRVSSAVRKKTGSTKTPDKSETPRGGTDIVTDRDGGPAKMASLKDAADDNSTPGDKGNPGGDPDDTNTRTGDDSKTVQQLNNSQTGAASKEDEEKANNGSPVEAEDKSKSHKMDGAGVRSNSRTSVSRKGEKKEVPTSKSSTRVKPELNDRKPKVSDKEGIGKEPSIPVIKAQASMYDRYARKTSGQRPVREEVKLTAKGNRNAAGAAAKSRRHKSADEPVRKGSVSGGRRGIVTASGNAKRHSRTAVSTPSNVQAKPEDEWMSRFKVGQGDDDETKFPEVVNIEKKSGKDSPRIINLQDREGKVSKDANRRTESLSGSVTYRKEREEEMVVDREEKQGEDIGKKAKDTYVGKPFNTENGREPEQFSVDRSDQRQGERPRGDRDLEEEKEEHDYGNFTDSFRADDETYVVWKRSLNAIRIAIKGSKSDGGWEDQSGSYRKEVILLIKELCNALYVMKHSDETVRAGFKQQVGNLMVEERIIQNLCAMFQTCYSKNWKNDRSVWAILDDCKFIIQSYTESCQDVTVEVCLAKGFLETLKAIIQLSSETHVNLKIEEKVESLVLSALAIVYNCCAYIDNIQRLRRVDIFRVTGTLMTSKNAQFSLLSLGVVASLATEKQCGIVGNQEVAILVRRMEDALKSPIRNCEGWSVKDCGWLLWKLARLDSLKLTLVEAGVLELLADMAESGNSEEQLQAVKAFRMLAFDDDAKTKIVTETKQDIVGLLVTLREGSAVYTEEAGEGSEDHTETEAKRRIREECDGALWNLRHRLVNMDRFRDVGLQLIGDVDRSPFPVQRDYSTESATERVRRNNVFISYQAANTDLVARIRDTLQDTGFTVYTNHGDGRQYGLKSMMDYVHNADVVLLCVSERYKNSANCRAEAEYVYEKRKKCIPIDTDPMYKPDGWLTIVTGAKVCLDFRTDQFFREKMNTLTKVIRKEMDNDEVLTREASVLSLGNQSKHSRQEVRSNDPDDSMTSSRGSWRRHPEFPEGQSSQNKPADSLPPPYLGGSQPHPPNRNNVYHTGGARGGRFDDVMSPSATYEEPTGFKQWERSVDMDDTWTVTDYPDRPALSALTGTIRGWTRDDVKNWITQHGLPRSMFETLTGDDIALLVFMQREAPESFYRCLQDWLKIRDLPHASKLVWALQDLVHSNTGA